MTRSSADIESLVTEVETSLSLDMDDEERIRRIRFALPNWQRAAPLLTDIGGEASAQGHPHLAKRLYEAAIEGGDERWAVHFNLGNALCNLGEDEAAVAAYGQAIEAEPHGDLPYCNRGVALLRIGRIQEGIDDLVSAARLGCEIDPMYDQLCEVMIRERGHEAVLQLVLSGGLPPEIQDRMFSELSTTIEERHYLLDLPSGVDRPPPTEYALQCILADCLSRTGRAADGPSSQATLLHHVLNEARRLDDVEMEWRAWYLMGVSAYADVAATCFPEHLPRDTPNIFLPFLGAGADDVFADILAIEFPELESHGVHTELAWLCLDRATSLLAGMETPATGHDFHWRLCEDVFREAARCAMFRQSAWDHVVIVERARRRYECLQPGDHPPPQIELFGSPTSEEISAELDTGTVLLQLFTSEIVEDRLVGSALSLDSGVVFEGSVSVKDTGEDLCGLLGRLLEANEHWIPREARLGVLRKHGDPASEIRSFALKVDFTSLPEDYPDEIEELILGPSPEYLRTCRRLIVLPFNYLHNFPVHALPSIRRAFDEGPLEEILYLPSAAAVVQLRRRPPPPRRRRSMLFVAFSEDGVVTHDSELETLSKHFEKIEVLVNDDANPARILKLLPRFDVVHFSCHGRYDVDEEIAVLEVANGGIAPRDIMGLDLTGVELVFANACISGSIPRSTPNGDQRLGLSTALLSAGCRHVVGNLWPVRNEVAEPFADHFYGGWIEGGCTISRSFAQAQSAVKTEFPRIDLWAPHVLYGTWH